MTQEVNVNNQAIMEVFPWPSNPHSVGYGSPVQRKPNEL